MDAAPEICDVNVGQSIDGQTVWIVESGTCAFAVRITGRSAARHSTHYPVDTHFADAVIASHQITTTAHHITSHMSQTQVWWKYPYE
jgi:hypothetical protein